MTITISIDATYPAFAVLPLDQLRKVAVGLGPSGMTSHWFVYNSEKENFGNVGDFGVSPATMGVSYRRPVTFSRQAFGVFGNITITDFNACRLATILADYVQKSVLKVVDNSVAVAGTTATATLAVTTPITLIDAPGGADGAVRNTTTFTVQVAAAASNPTNTVLAVFTGTSAAITVTVTPNDGTNNAATPVGLTTAQLVELINTGAVAGKTITLIDGSSLRALQSASGGGVAVLADGGEGDGVLGTFSGGVTSVAGTLTADQVLTFVP